MWFYRLFLFVILFPVGAIGQESDTTLIRLEKRIKDAPTDSLKSEAILEFNAHQLKRDFLNFSTYAIQEQLPEN